MPDFRVADTAPEHIKLRRAGLPAAGLWALAGAYAMRELTDGWVPDYWVQSWPSGKRCAKTLVDVGLWQQHKRGPLAGYRFHDWADYQRSAEQIAAASSAAVTRRAVYSDPELVALVRGRDQDRCRYCEREVNWRDRRGRGGGTYDHVIPLVRGGDNEPENVVVACRGCNSKKQDRTPEKAGMQLLPAPPRGQNGSKPDLDPELDPNQVSSDPPHPGPYPGGGSGGRESSGSERAQDRDAPRPRCPKHAELPPDQRVPSCGACKQLRLAAEQQVADQAERVADERARRRALIDDCPDCDDTGMRDFGDLGVGRCTHPTLTAAAS